MAGNNTIPSRLTTKIINYETDRKKLTNIINKHIKFITLYHLALQITAYHKMPIKITDTITVLY